MKKIAIVILLTLAISKQGLGQSLYTSDIMNLSVCDDLNCAKDFLTSKGFSFETMQPSESTNIYVYLSDQAIDVNGVTVKNSCTFTLLNNVKLINTGYRTVNRINYNQVLEGFKRLGFNPTKNNSSGDKIVVHYRSDRYKDLDLMITTEKRNKGQSNWTSYDFELLKLSKL